MLRSFPRFGLLLVLVFLLGGSCFTPAEASPTVQVDEARTLFQGITYQREVRHEPRLNVIHHVTVDLTAPGLEFFVRPGTPGEPQPLQITSAFLDEYGLQLAINANYFTKVESGGLLDWLYVAGEPAYPSGLAMAEGVAYQSPMPDWPSLYITADNHLSFEVEPPDTWNAITGNYMLLRYGERAIHPITNERTGIHPRTAIGLDRAGTTLTIVVVDGRQPGYSEGLSLWELGDLLREYGVEFALNLDGGGSSTLVIEGPDGRPQVLNSPIGNRVPGWERPVAVHRGRRALPAS
jgi:hypothetical protein